LLLNIYIQFQGLHSASVPGILALDIHNADTSKILTGGADKNATVFNKDTEQVVAILKGHTKKVHYINIALSILCHCFLLYIIIGILIFCR